MFRILLLILAFSTTAFCLPPVATCQRGSTEGSPTRLYHFNETAGTSAYSAITSTYGVLTGGAAFAAGKIGNGVRCTAASAGSGDDYVLFGDHDDFTFGTGEFAISFWVNWNSLHTDYNQMIQQTDKVAVWWDFQYIASGNQLRTTGSGYSGTNNFNYTMALATWYLVTYVRRGNDFELWVSSSYITKITDAAANLPNVNGNCYLGWDTITGTRAPDATFDDFMIIKGRAPTGGEILGWYYKNPRCSTQ